MPEAVIIAGKLDDKSLRESIDALVQHVNTQTAAMAKSFDNAISNINNSFKGIGNLKINVGDAAKVDNSTRIKQNAQEAKTVKETTIAYDQLAIAMQKATQPKSAEQSFYTFIQNYREQAAKLASELKNMPSQSLDKQFANYQRFEQEITNVRNKIQDLRAQLNEVGKSPNVNRFQIKAITDQIGLYENRIKQLTFEQITSTRRIANADAAAMNEKKAIYDKTIQLVRELTIEQDKGTSATNRQISLEQRRTEEIRRQAQAIRESQQWREQGFAFVQMGAKSDSVVYNKKNITLEEQLLQIHQRISAEKEAQARAEQRAMQEKANAVQMAQQQANIERQIVQEKQQQTKPKSFKDYEDFRQALASVLGLQRSEVNLANANTASYNRLHETLKLLQTAYNRLTTEQRNSDNGKALVSSIHEVQQAIQKVQAQANRPINLRNVLGLSEKTLDEIAYKIQKLSAYRSGLNLNSQYNEINQVSKAIENLQRKQREIIGSTSRWGKENNALSRSFEYMKNRLAFIFTIGSTTSFVKQIYDIRGQYELLERSIGILVDSMQQGTQIFAELNAMAIKSPFTTMELGAAAKQLVAYDVAAKDVVDTTKRLADMAAAVGVPIDRLTYALGQIKAYGYLNARDARMFANAGIPLVKELADRYTELEGRLVSVGDVYSRIKKKAVSFEDVMDVIKDVTSEGGKFFNFQEKAADTLKVKLANLTLAWNNMLNEVGKSNQNLLTQPLVLLKKLFESWRTIDNVLWSIITTFGLLKIAQFGYLTLARSITAQHSAQLLAGTKLTKMLRSLWASLGAFAGNPFAMVSAGLAALGFVIAKTIFDYRDLQKANENFNHSIANNAKENIETIKKFFGEYQKQLNGVNTLSIAEQQKLWERIQEEIEQTSKNAKQYISLLNDIQDNTEKISFGQAVLQQTREIQKEAQRLAEHGFLDLGGGYLDDSLAEDLKDVEKRLNVVIKTYGSLDEASKNATRTQRRGTQSIATEFGEYLIEIEEVNNELKTFTTNLDRVNIDKIMGSSADLEVRLANIREFASIVRDNFLATEQGQKIGAEGRSLLNKALDEWIAKQGVANNLITEERALIESNRTAWELFFDQIGEEDRKRVDYMIRTNQTGSEDFKEIWDKAANSMKESAQISYNSIQEQIQRLRNTPDIVINVVYKESKEQLDKQQEEFNKRFIEPGGAGAVTVDRYFELRKKNVEKYGRFLKKSDEDNVEWEKRLGEEYQNVTKRIESLNNQLANRAKLSKVDREAKEEELKQAKQEKNALDDIRKAQAFNYAQFAKGGKKGSKKDVLGGALTEEIRLISEIQKKYKEYRELGFNAQDAIARATQEYNKTLIKNNAILNKYGIQTLTSDELAKLPLQKVRDFYSEQLKIANALGNTKGIEALEKIIANINLEITKIDYKKISEGLNNELNKLKEEYELGVELDANPELGSLFLDLFDIDPNNLTKTIDDYANKVLGELNKSFEKRKIDFRLPTLDLTNDDIKSFQEQVEGGTLDKATFDLIKQKYNEIRALRSKDATETLRQTQELQYKLADVNGKIAIEQKKLSDLQIRYEKETREEKKKLLELEIEDQKQTIQKLGEEVLQMLPFYEKLFGYEADHSARITRKLAKDAKALVENAKKNADGSYTITDENGKSATISAKEYGKLLDKINKKLRETESSWAKIKEAFTKGEDKVIDISEGFALLGSEIQNIANEAKELSDVLSDVGVNFSDDINYAIEGLGQAGEGMAEAAQGYASGNYIQMAVGATKALVGFGKTFAGIFGGTKKDYFTSLKESLENLLEVMNKVSSYQLEALGRMTGSQAASEYRKLLQNNETIIQSYRDLANAAGRSGSSWGSHSYAYRTNRNLKGDWEEISKYANETVTSIQDMYNLDPSQLKEIMTNMPTEWAKIDKNIREALESIIEYGDKAQEYTIALGEALTNISLDDLTNDFEGMLQDMDSKSEDFAENFEEYMRNAIIRSMMVGTYAEELENWYNNFKERIKDDELSEQDVEALRQEYMDIVNRALEERGRLTSVIGEAARQGDLSSLQQGIQGITETTANALEAYMNSVSQQVYYQSSLLESINTLLQGFNNDVSVATQAQMLLQLQQSYQVQMAIQNILIGWSNPSGQAIRVEMI